jgi:hypothetical protein
MTRRYDGPINWKITPDELVRQRGWQSRRRGQEIEIRYCPYCGGGRSRDKWKFAINSQTGQFKCMKGSCPAAVGGGFWDLLEASGLNPVDFIDRTGERKQTKGSKTMSMNGFKRDYTFAHHAPNPGANIVGGKEKVEYKAPYTPAQSLSASAQEWLRARHISDDVIWTWELASDPAGDILFRYYEGRSTAGRPAGHVFSKLRILKPADDGRKARRDAGGKPILYGTWLCDSQVSKVLVLVAGEIDAITVSQAGVPNVVSLPSGDNDHGFIDLQWQWLGQWERIVLWMDGDQSGQRAMHILAKRLGRQRCFQVDTPYKDANDLLQSFVPVKGREETDAHIRQLVEDAGAYQLEDIVDMATAMEALEHGVEETGDDASLTRWGAIDAATKGFHPGDTYLVFGDAGSGKSTVVANLACERIQSGSKVLLYSGEMSLQQCGRWVEGILAGPQHSISETDKASGAVDHKPDPMVLPRLRSWYRGKLSFYKVFGALDPDAFFDGCEYAVRRFGIDTIVIDSLTTAFPPGTDDLYQAQGEFAWRARHFAEEFGAVIILLMHTTAESSRNGAELEPPKLGAMRGANVVKDAATHVLSVWRVPVEKRKCPPTEKKPNRYYETDNVISLLKNRDRGEQVQARMGFEPKSKRFYQQANPVHQSRRFGWEDAPATEPVLVSAATPVEPAQLAESFEPTAPLQPASTEPVASSVIDDAEWDAFLESKRAAGELHPPSHEPVWVEEIPF